MQVDIERELCAHLFASLEQADRHAISIIVATLVFSEGIRIILIELKAILCAEYSHALRHCSWVNKSSNICLHGARKLLGLEHLNAVHKVLEEETLFVTISTIDSHERLDTVRLYHMRDVLDRNIFPHSISP